MEIKKLTEYKGASRYGSCIECGENESDTHRLYRLQFRGVSICLCPDCFRKTRVKMNDVILDGYIGRTESEEKELADKFWDIREMIDQIATLIEPEDVDESENKG